MPSYAVRADVPAEPAAVFPVVADLARHGEWSADPVEVTAVDDVPLGTGKRYRSTARSKGKTITADLEVTEYQVPTTFGFTVRDLTGSWRHRFDLTSVPGGTRVTRTITGTLSPAQTLLFYVVLPLVKRPNASKALDRLRRRVAPGGEAA